MSMHGDLRLITLSQDKCDELSERACAQREDNVWRMSIGCVLDADIESG